MEEMILAFVNRATTEHLGSVLHSTSLLVKEANANTKQASRALRPFQVS